MWDETEGHGGSEGRRSKGRRRKNWTERVSDEKRVTEVRRSGGEERERCTKEGQRGERRWEKKREHQGQGKFERTREVLD